MLINRIVNGSALLVAAGLTLQPQATLAAGSTSSPALLSGTGTQGQPPPPQNVTVQISDAGFDQPSYTGSTLPWPSPNNGTVTFKNVGTKVHTATYVPGSASYGVRMLSRTDATGTPLTCFSNGGLFPDGCGRLGVLDSGGIDAGGSATVAFPNGAGTFSITSATDCLNGNSTPGFNCTPASLTEVMAQPDPIAIFYPGSVFNTPGSASCTTTTTPATGAPVCFTKSRQWQSVGGSPQAPLNGATVTIDDVKGFQPSILYIVAGTAITWVNKARACTA